MSTPATRARVLLVDDDDTFRHVLSEELAHRGFVVATAATAKAALARARAAEHDVILLDLRLPDQSGLDVLKRLREDEVSAGVVMLTGHGTVDTAIRAIRMGAYDYLEKPCPIEKVQLVIEKTLEYDQLLARKEVLQDGFAARDVRAGFVGDSPAFRELCRAAERIARADTTTLIQGETGVGKEMVARLLHTHGPRRDAAFVVINCAALDDELLRSELFGHQKGAFTGAVRRKHGLFEVAHGGTLLLDEVGDATPEIQAKLLRVLESGRFRRVGGTEEVVVDVRIISATNRDLREAVARGRFREDLYFRLATFTIDVPPLRARVQDIPLLIEHYTHRLNRRYSTAGHLTPEAIDVLCARPWPGNVRELIHVLEQVLVLSGTAEIGPADLPPSTASHVKPPPPCAGKGEVLPLREVQKRHVLDVVERAGGNRAKAARLLEVSERNLYRLLDKYGWVPPGSNAATRTAPDA